MEKFSLKQARIGGFVILLFGLFGACIFQACRGTKTLAYESPYKPVGVIVVRTVHDTVNKASQPSHRVLTPEQLRKLLYPIYGAEIQRQYELITSQSEIIHKQSMSIDKLTSTVSGLKNYMIVTRQRNDSARKDAAFYKKAYYTSIAERSKQSKIQIDQNKQQIEGLNKIINYITIAGVGIIIVIIGLYAAVYILWNKIKKLRKQIANA